MKEGCFLEQNNVQKNHAKIFGFQDESGNWEVDEEQTMKMKCDFVISAFGSGLYSQDLKSAIAPLKLTRWGTPEVAIDNTSIGWLYD